MRQWKTMLSSDYTLDNRDREKLLKEMTRLAASYTPEWQLDKDNPDIGSCIALLYADEMQELIKRYNSIPERNCVDLVNMLNISLRAAYPAHSEVVMEIAGDTVAGIKLPKGMKLLASAGEEKQLIFETAGTVYITSSKLVAGFITSAASGNVYPVMGSFEPVCYVDEDDRVSRADFDEDEENEKSTTDDIKSLSDEELFEVEQSGSDKIQPIITRTFNMANRTEYGLHGLLLYHSYIFDVQNNDIIMQLDGGKEIVDGIMDGKYLVRYYTASGFVSVDSIRRSGEERIIFQKSCECQKVKHKGKKYSLLLIEPVNPVVRNVMVSKISFASRGEEQSADFVWDTNTELEPDKFKPFGEILANYAQIDIAHEDYFTKPGAVITISFDLSFGKKLVSVPGYKEDERLKVIKRKPQKDIYGAPVDVFADEIVIEYFNGTGWKKIDTAAPVSQLFQNVQAGKCEISFICPDDWAESETGSQSAHCLRIRLLRADNCYYQPALHNFPIINNLGISYSYLERMDTPQRIVCFQGSRQKDMTSAMEQNNQIPVFIRNPYNTTSLYLGFDKKLEDGPVSIMLGINSREGFMGRRLKYYYSTRDGFERLKLIDNTDGLEHTGTICFIPPTDMARMVLEGKEAYWIRITDAAADAESKQALRDINDIRVNAVEVDNIDTLPVQDYYIDRFGPGMTFNLNTDNILDAQVWVNEIGSYTQNEMNNMLMENPEYTRAERDLGGRIHEFYIKWSEVDNFDSSTSDDRHYVIDRQNNTISFGDGVHVRIPKNTKGIAFKVITRRCDGSKANVAPEVISEPYGNLLFVENIYNPMPAFGGMDMETLDEALKRGAAQLGNRKRLISAQDYEREVLNFSGSINQVKVVQNVLRSGENIPGAVSIVIFMNDFMDGDGSFQKMKERLKEHLVKRCELSVNDKYLQVVKPIFVRISVQIWVRLIETDDSFEMQQHLINVLNEYLNPLANCIWDIGRMVNLRQIEMKLNIEKKNALIERVMLLSEYEDELGWHEADVSLLQENPYVLVTNGVHKVHFL